MKLRILLADDHPMFREGLRTMLTGRDAFDVVAMAGSGREAVAIAKQERPDVAVLDLRMPDGDGAWATAEMHTATPNTRVLILTSFEDQSAVADALAAGAHGYLLKSAHPDEIAQAILTVAAGSSVLSDHVLGDLTGSRASPSWADSRDSPAHPGTVRFVATVLFSDIVDSTRIADQQGDLNWSHLLDEHDTVVERDVSEAGGRVIKQTGDGILATFDNPGQAVLCALKLHESTKQLGLTIRIGLHTGEIQRRGHDIGGIAVHIAARVMAQASPGDVLVSRTVVDLTAGSALVYKSIGEVDLRGLAGKRQLYRAIHA